MAPSPLSSLGQNSHQSRLDSREENIDPTFWWEERVSHISREWGMGYIYFCVYLWKINLLPCESHMPPWRALQGRVEISTPSYPAQL